MTGFCPVLESENCSSASVHLAFLVVRDGNNDGQLCAIGAKYCSHKFKLLHNSEWQKGIDWMIVGTLGQYFKNISTETIFNRNGKLSIWFGFNLFFDKFSVIYRRRLIATWSLVLYVFITLRLVWKVSCPRHRYTCSSTPSRCQARGSLNHFENFETYIHVYVYVCHRSASGVLARYARDLWFESRSSPLALFASVGPPSPVRKRGRSTEEHNVFVLRLIRKSIKFCKIEFILAYVYFIRRKSFLKDNGTQLLLKSDSLFF